MVDLFSVRLPKVSANDETATILEWKKTSGENVQKGEIICSVETTKSIVDIEAPESGYLTPLAGLGTEAMIGAVIAVISAQPEAQEVILARIAEMEAQPALSETGNGDTAGWTFKAKLLAQKHGIPMVEVVGSQGRVTEEDVLKQISQRQKPANGNGKDLMDDVYPHNRVQRLLVIGGGDGAVQILDVVAKCMHQRVVGIVDDNPSLQGKAVGGVPVAGTIDIERLVQEFEHKQFDAAVISISTLIPVRERIFKQLKSRGIPFANVIHPSAVIGANVSLGEGNVIMAFCHIGACAAIGNNNFLSAYCSIEHHNQMGDHCSFGPGVLTSSRVVFGDRVRCGTGIFIEPKLSIGADSVIGSGCIIWKDIPERSILKSKLNYVERIR